MNPPNWNGAVLDSMVVVGKACRKMMGETPTLGDKKLAALEKLAHAWQYLEQQRLQFIAVEGFDNWSPETAREYWTLSESSAPLTRAFNQLLKEMCMAQFNTQEAPCENS